MAFGVGAAIGFVLLMVQSGPIVLRIALSCLSPGYWLAGPFLQVLLPRGLGFAGLIWGLIAWSAVINGALYALLWYLRRIARTGRRVARFALLAGAGVWVAWGAWWSARHWPQPDPPPAPVDFSSPLTGRWEGVGHGKARDFPAILICHPRTDGTLDGLFYASGHLIGPIELGAHAGDSLRFLTPGFLQFGHRDGTRMTLESRIGHWTQRIELAFASADTSRVPGIVQEY